MIHLKSIPFLKIILPYLLGLLICINFGIFQSLHLVFALVALLWLITFIFQKITTAHKAKKIIFVLLTNALLFISAFESCFVYNARININHYSNYHLFGTQNIFARVNNIPVKGERFIKVPIDVSCIQSNNQWKYSQGQSYVYIKKELAKTPNLGDILFFKANFNVINPTKNPGEFDYKAYLERQNIFSVAYPTDTIIKIQDDKFQYRPSEIGVVIKSKLIGLLRTCELSQEAFSIGAALMLGYDDEIENDILQSFSHSGTLHILSVSGMHTGVLYAILIWVFSLIDKHERYKKTRCLVIISFLILFVLITGVSPSVLRAALMLALMVLGQTFYKKGNSYNTLLFSAFIILLYNPYLIIDVGFLLSYLAVFGILYLYPLLFNRFPVQQPILKFLWSSVLISFSATLFTLPISLFYFHQFPIWFVVSNIIIIPISTALLVLTILLVALYKLVFIKTMLVVLINSLTSLMLWFTRLTDHPKFGFIDFIPFSAIDFFLLSVLICFMLIAFQLKSYKFLIASGWIGIFWILSSIICHYQQSQEKELTVFHVKRKTAYIVRIGHQVYASLHQLSDKEFQRYVKPYLLGISNLSIIQANDKIISMPHTTVTNSTWISPPKNSNSSIIIVSNNQLPEIKHLHQNKITIIADCTNSYTFVKKLKKQCAQLHIECYAINEQGSISIKL